VNRAYRQGTQRFSGFTVSFLDARIQLKGSDGVIHAFDEAALMYAFLAVGDISGNHEAENFGVELGFF
jgi:hypothetical protein